MKRALLLSALIGVFLISVSVFAQITGQVTLPDKVPNIMSQTAQKEKSAIVLINSIVSGTVNMPSYQMVQGSGGSGSGIVGTWQSNQETVTFTAAGQFSGTGPYSDAFAGTYTLSGTTLSLIYTLPGYGTYQFTCIVSGNTMSLTSSELGTTEYTRAGSQGGTDVVSNAENLMIVREEGTSARVLSDEVSDGVSGTGFVISPDGYIVTNAHVVLAGEDPEAMLLNAVANSFANTLYEEASTYYNIPDADKEKVVQILLNKFMTYFVENGRFTGVTTNFYVLSGAGAPGEDLQIKSWPAFVKKQGTVSERIGGEDTWGRDVAILKVEKSNLQTVTLGDSDSMEAGDEMFVIGYPGAASGPLFQTSSLIEPTVTRGVVSAKKTLVTGIEVIQTDTAINPGNSGGPAFNDKGEVVGIATFMSTQAQNIGFLMPINLAKEFMNELNVQNKAGTVDQKYDQALNAFWNRDCYTAMARMKEVLVLSPNHPYAQDYITECEQAIASGEVSPPLDIGSIIGVILVLVVVGGGLFYLNMTGKLARIIKILKK